ncbi:hypothetical protein [Variovorax paradoxus]|uniref:hypothetical protein n=1 Tax=Variovorax paradoxus TaxID=34073 RepID=UPI003D650EB0
MNKDAFRKQAPLPVAIHRKTGEPLNLGEWQADPDAAVGPADLGLEQQIALVAARWRAGGWPDLIYGTDGEIDAERAIREMKMQSAMGRHLLAIGLRAIEMARADAGQGE